MSIDEVKTMMESLDPTQLVGGKTLEARAEGCFRWHVLQLLENIAESQAQTAYAYTEMLKIQQVKSGLAGMNKSRYGGGPEAAAVTNG